MIGLVMHDTQKKDRDGLRVYEIKAGGVTVGEVSATSGFMAEITVLNDIKEYFRNKNETK